MNAQQISEVILQQLGGNKFRAMTGAKDFVYGTDKAGNAFLRFKLHAGFAKPLAGKKTNMITVPLTPADTYNITFGYVRGLDYKVLETVEGIYCDMLQDIFTSKTGLDTHL